MNKYEIKLINKFLHTIISVSLFSKTRLIIVSNSIKNSGLFKLLKRFNAFNWK